MGGVLKSSTIKDRVRRGGYIQHRRAATNPLLKSIHIIEYTAMTREGLGHIGKVWA